MIIDKNKNGSIIITDIINNNYFKKIYYGYSVKECKKLFKQYIKEL